MFFPCSQKEHTSLHSLSILSYYVAISCYNYQSVKLEYKHYIIYYYQKYLDVRKNQVSPEKTSSWKSCYVSTLLFKTGRASTYAGWHCRHPPCCPGVVAWGVEWRLGCLAQWGWWWWWWWCSWWWSMMMMMMMMIMSIFIGLYVFCEKKLDVNMIPKSRKKKIQDVKIGWNCPPVGLRMNLIPTTLCQTCWEIICPVDLIRRKMGSYPATI